MMYVDWRSSITCHCSGEGVLLDEAYAHRGRTSSRLTSTIEYAAYGGVGWRNDRSLNKARMCFSLVEKLQRGGGAGRELLRPNITWGIGGLDVYQFVKKPFNNEGLYSVTTRYCLGHRLDQNHRCLQGIPQSMG